MKQIFTLLVAGMLCSAAKSQLVLNELYTDPGNNKSEFFELYNTGIASESANNYTLVSYFKSSSLGQGFYVLDLPNITVPGKGFFVGSSKQPFDYQGVTNSNRSNFAWNDHSWLSNNEGNLTEWKLSANNLLDGNLFYDKVSLSGSFNDFFDRLSGNGSSYVVFLFKNGILVNSMIAGSGGERTIPVEITTMPVLNISMLGAAPAFTIDFSPFGSLPVEPINQDAGSDNGFMRTIDGACGKWTKSSSSANQTPQMSNGSLTTSTTGDIQISSTVTRGSISTGSVVTYKIVSATASALPAVLNVYIDNGSVPGELDVNDALLTTTITGTIGQSYMKGFFPFDANILVVAKNAAGCIDNMKMASQASTLPVKVSSFAGRIEDSKALLSWTAEENETGNLFELQSSQDGKSFQTTAVVFTTEKNGTENYSYKEPKEISGTIYYRLKIVNKDKTVSYSRIISLSANKNSNANKIILLENPINSSLQFLYASQLNQSSIVNIYNVTGTKLFTTQLQLQKGVNSFQLDINWKINSGSYLLELITNNERTIAKFLKK